MIASVLEQFESGLTWKNPSNIRSSAENTLFTFGQLGLEERDEGQSFLTSLEQSLPETKNAQELGQKQNFIKQAEAFVRDFFQKIKNEDNLQNPALMAEEVEKLRSNMTDLRRSYNAFYTTQSNKIKKAISRVGDEVEKDTVKRLDKMSVDAGKKILIDIDGASARVIDIQKDPKTEAEKDTQKKAKQHYKSELINLAEKLADKNYAFWFIKNAEARHAVEVMQLSEKDKRIFWLAYRRRLKKYAPSTLAMVGKEKLSDGVAYVKNGAKKTAGRGLSALGSMFASGLRSADVNITHIGNKVMRKKNAKKGQKGFIELFGKVIGNKITEAYTTAKTAVKTGATAIRSARGIRQTINVSNTLVSKTSSFVRTTAKFIDYSSKATVSGISGAAKYGLAAGILTIAGGGSPALVAAAAGSGFAISGANRLLKVTLPPNQLLNTVSTRRLYFLRATEAAGSAVTGSIAGSLVGFAVAGPAGLFVGSIAGGIGGATTRVAYDVYKYRANQNVLNGKVFGTAQQAPMASLSNIYYGNELLEKFTRLGLEEGSRLVGLEDTELGRNVQKRALTQSEKDALLLKDPRWYMNLFNFAFNTLTAATYLQSMFSLVGTTGYYTFWINRIGNLFNSLGSMRYMPLKGLWSSIGSGSTRIAGNLSVTQGSLMTTRIARYTSIGAMIGSILGIVVATVAGLNIGIAAAVGGAIGGGIGAAAGAGVAGGTSGIGAGAIPWFVGGGSFLGTLAGSLVDTYILKTPQVFNPLVVFQGIWDFLKLFNTPLRDIRDYAVIGMILVSLVGSLAALSQFTGSNSVDAVETEKNEARYQTQIVYTADAIDYDVENNAVILNDTPDDIYTFSNVNSVEEMTNGNLVIFEDNNYWVLENPGKYAYNPETKKLAGKSERVTAQIYTDTLNVLAQSSDLDNNTNVLGAADLNGIQKLTLCDLYIDMCE